MAGSEYLDLACQGLTCFSPDCAFWLLDMEEDGPLNVYAVFRGFLPMLTVQELPFQECPCLVAIGFYRGLGGGSCGV